MTFLGSLKRSFPAKELGRVRQEKQGSEAWQGCPTMRALAGRWIYGTELGERRAAVLVDRQLGCAGTGTPDLQDRRRARIQSGSGLAGALDAMTAAARSRSVCPRRHKDRPWSACRTRRILLRRPPGRAGSERSRAGRAPTRLPRHAGRQGASAIPWLEHLNVEPARPELDPASRGDPSHHRQALGNDIATSGGDAAWLFQVHAIRGIPCGDQVPVSHGFPGSHGPRRSSQPRLKNG